MRVAVCDPDAFYPLRSLVSGPLDSLEDLSAIERFVRTVVLHDEIVMEIEPMPYDPETDFEFTEAEKRAGGRTVIVGFGPLLDGYDFFLERTGPQPVPNIELPPALIEVASKYANAGEGNVYFNAHIEYLKRVLGVVKDGGSALVCGRFGEETIRTARRYPAELFQELDKDWQCYARQIEQDGSGLLIPPVLGIVLTRCARREAIPRVIRDLRDEWSRARHRVWDLLDALRTPRTLDEALEIRRELSEASKQFSPGQSELDSRPLRVLWDVIYRAGESALIARLSGGNACIGAATGAIAQAGPELRAFMRDFGRAIFGRGAFDLARRVRRAAAQIELDALPRLLTDAERHKLGLR